MLNKLLSAEQTRGRMQILLVVAVLMLSALVVAGCGSSGTPTPTPQSIVEQASTKMLDQAAFNFDIEASGGTAYVDTGKTTVFNKASGDLVKPDKVKATLNVALMGFVAELNMVGVGDKQEYKNPLTGRWENVPSGWNISPVVFFDAQNGVPGVVKKVKDLKQLPDEKIDGADSYHLAGTVAGSDISPLTFGMVQGDQIGLDIWIGKADSLVRQMKLQEPQRTEGKPVTWLIKLSKFGESVDIQLPAQ